MKKVAFMFVAAMAMSFAACTGNQKAETEAVDSTNQVVNEAIDQAVEEAAAEKDSLNQANGDSLTQVAPEVDDQIKSE